LTKKNESGVTLLELMFAVAVLALILGIGVPSFGDFVRNSRMSAAANDLITDLSVARSEAVKRRVPISLCKSANGTNCDTDADLNLYTNVDAHRVFCEVTGFPRAGVENLTLIRLCDARKNAPSVGGRPAARMIQIQATGRAAVTNDVARIQSLGGCP
jgi:prepilin-type N-terminal cleavage/methylation domain-containing protein